MTLLFLSVQRMGTPSNQNHLTSLTVTQGKTNRALWWSKQDGIQPWLKQVLFYSTEAFMKQLLKKKLQLIKRDKTLLYNDCRMLSCTKPFPGAASGLDHSWGWCTQQHQNQNQTRIYSIVCNSISKSHTKLCGFFWIILFVLSFPPLIKQVQKHLPC